jgi:hypothetical protein
MFLQEHSADLQFFSWLTKMGITGKPHSSYVHKARAVKPDCRNAGSKKGASPELWNSHFGN